MRFPLVIAACIVTALTTGSAAAVEGTPDEATLKVGERVFMLCKACHTVGKDGGNKIGPNLYGVFGSKAGSKPTFQYSTALKNSGIAWTDDTLDKWLANPFTFIPGTRMSFAGVHEESERRAVIAYLKHQTGAQ